MRFPATHPADYYSQDVSRHVEYGCTGCVHEWVGTVFGRKWEVCTLEGGRHGRRCARWEKVSCETKDMNG